MIGSSSSRISKLHWRAAGPAVTGVMLLMLAIAPPAAQAQTFTTLYSFQGIPDGSEPFADLVTDEQGNLYGTTVSGGDSPNCPLGCGTVFKVDSAGNESVLHSFAFHDGARPFAPLLRDKIGNLYGTAEYGGNSAFCRELHGCGTVYQLELAGRFRVLHYFHGPPSSGAAPFGGLIFENGSLYGTTFYGGASSCNHGCGTVYAMDLRGNETVLYNFKGGADGANPYSDLVSDGVGNFYGTTENGGAFGFGSVFQVDASGNETVLYSFRNGSDGAFPIGGLSRDAIGNLYGTTESGGTHGAGTVYMLDASANETVLYNFTNGTDGGFPRSTPVRDAAGNLYGITPQGGDLGVGAVFMLSAAGKFRVLHSFAGSDGAYPQGGLLRTRLGNIYGTTPGGGAFDWGTVFKITP